MIIKFKPQEKKTKKFMPRIKEFFGQDNKSVFDGVDNRYILCMNDDNTIQIETLIDDEETMQNISEFLDYVFPERAVGVIAYKKVNLSPQVAKIYFLNNKDLDFDI